MLGIGLGIDYGLLMISRFREERGAGRDVPAALRPHDGDRRPHGRVLGGHRGRGAGGAGSCSPTRPSARSAFGGIGVVLTHDGRGAHAAAGAAGRWRPPPAPAAAGVVARRLRPAGARRAAAGGARRRAGGRRPGAARRAVPPRPLRRHRRQGAAAVVGDPPGRRGDRRPRSRPSPPSPSWCWPTWTPTTRASTPGWPTWRHCAGVTAATIDEDLPAAVTATVVDRARPRRGRDERAHGAGRRVASCAALDAPFAVAVGGDPAEIVDLRASITSRLPLAVGDHRGGHVRAAVPDDRVGGRARSRRS